MTIRPGGVDGQTEIDRGLLKASTTPGSDVLSLDGEFTVTEGRFVRRKFWHAFTVSGGKVDEKGASIGWNISKRTFRAMIDSALGLDPDDNSEEAKAKRRLRGLADLDGITFVAKITVEPSTRSPLSGQEQARPAGAAEREGVARGHERRGRGAEPLAATFGQQRGRQRRHGAEARLGPAAGQARAAGRCSGMAAARNAAPPGRRQRPAGEARRPCVAEPVTRSAGWLGRDVVRAVDRLQLSRRRRQPEPSPRPWGRIPSGRTSGPARSAVARPGASATSTSSGTTSTRPIASARCAAWMPARRSPGGTAA